MQKNILDTKSERSNSANGNTWCRAREENGIESGMDIDEKNSLPSSSEH